MYKGATVTLNGTNSVDPDGDPITYIWTILPTSNVTLHGAGSATPSFTVPSVILNANYTLVLIVSDGVNTATDSVTITVMDAQPPTPSIHSPATPTNLTATSTVDSVTLTWDDPGDDSVTGHKILYRAPDTQSAFAVLVGDTGSTATTYVATGLEPGTTYQFQVAALSGSGASAASPTVTVSTGGAQPPPTQPPPAPRVCR